MVQSDKEAFYRLLSGAAEFATWGERRNALEGHELWRHLLAHEVGHAIATLVLGGNVAWVSVDPSFLYKQGISKTPAMCMGGGLNGELKHLVSASGEFGDRLSTGSADPSSVKQDHDAIHFSASIMLRRTRPELTYPCEAFDEAARLYVDNAVSRAEQLFGDPLMPQIVAEACDALARSGTLTGDELKERIMPAIEALRNNHKDWIDTLDDFAVRDT